MEYKGLPILTKEIGADRTVKSLFNVFGQVDDGGDRVWNGAFAKTLTERADRVRVLWQHYADEPPIGVPIKLFEMSQRELPSEILTKYPNATGALCGHVKYLDTPRGNEVLTGIREGAITENSIGYDALKYDFENFGSAQIRNLREVRLWDVSAVNWGMNEAAQNIKRVPPLTGLDALAQLTTYYADDERLMEAVGDLRTARALKEGRVLSSNNLKRLKDALAVLQEILQAAEPGDETAKAKALRVLRRLAIAERELLIYQ